MLSSARAFDWWGPIRLQISFSMPYTNSQQIDFEHHSMLMHMKVLRSIDGLCSSIICFHCNTFKQKQAAVYAVYICGLSCKHTASTGLGKSQNFRKTQKAINFPSQNTHPHWMFVPLHHTRSLECGQERLQTPKNSKELQNGQRTAPPCWKQGGGGVGVS